MKKALVLGGNGFIGHHMARRLKSEGYFVTVADIKKYEYGGDPFSHNEEIGDLRNPHFVKDLFGVHWDEVYQFAADMGGAGFIFTGDHDADIMHNSATINLNVAWYASQGSVGKLFYSSSACIYPQQIQEDPENDGLPEWSAFPANPDSEYGWEKIFSERLYESFRKNYGLNIRIARFHNIFGPEGTWTGGREKAPAAMCRKACEAHDGGVMEVWGDGKQTRSFLYIDECIEGVRRLMGSSFDRPINIGSEERISINALASMAIKISGKSIQIKNIPGPEGVRGRNSDNDVMRDALKWEPEMGLFEGMALTYKWIENQIHNG